MDDIFKDAAVKLADLAYENNREPEEEFLHLSKNLAEERRTDLWSYVQKLSFNEKVRLLERAEREYGI